MSKHAKVQNFEQKYMKTDLTDFRVGDTVRVHTIIIEGNKERIQMFTGTVIARSGSGVSETFSVHRVAYGEGMERVFPLHSPRIAKIEVLKEGDVRRSKLYYLRGTSGKKARVKGRVGVGPRSTKKQAVAEINNKEPEEIIVEQEHEPATEVENVETPPTKEEERDKQPVAE